MLITNAQGSILGTQRSIGMLLEDEKAVHIINAQGPFYGYTPLHDAVWNDHYKSAKLLVEYGCQKYLQGHDGFTPIDFAKRLNPTEMLNFLK